MKIRHIIVFFISLFSIFMLFTSCFFKVAPSNIIIISPKNNSNVFSDEVLFSWKLSNFAIDVNYDFYFGDDINNLQLIQANIKNPEYSLNSLSKFQQYFWKIIAKNEYGESESSGFSFMICDEYPRNPQPEDFSTNVSTDTILSWECSCPEDSTLTYNIYLSDNNNPSLIKENCCFNNYEPEGLFSGTEYKWKVVAIDGINNYESKIWTFQTLPDPDNNPPDVPDLLNPLDNSIDQPIDIILEWNCTDLDGDSLIYDLYFGTNPQPQFYTNDIDATSFEISSLNKGTIYYWKILAKDGRGGTTFSEIHDFTTIVDPDNNPPSKPGTPTPINEATDQPTNTTLSWKCSDPDGDTLKYDIYFGDNSNPPLVSFEQANDNFNPGELNTGTTYYWKIVAKDGRGGVTEGDKWEFITIPDPGNNTPDVPDLLNPLDNSLAQPIDIILEWNCTDPDGDSLIYDLYFGTNPQPQFYTNDIDATSFEISPLNKGTIYYWKILAKDGRGGTTFSKIHDFTTIVDPDNNPPTKPGTPTPINEATDQPTNTTLSWECSDPDGDTLKYDIYFGDNSNPPLVSFEQTNVNFNPEELNTGTAYYWKIVAKDGRGGVTEGDKWEFITIPDPDNNPPYTPDLLNPLDNSIDQPIDIILEWNCTDPDGDSLIYDLYFGTNPQPQFYTNDIDATSFEISLLNKGTIYYWKVLAKDGRGGTTFSEIHDFTTIVDPDNNPPSKPGTPTPINEATDQPTNTTISWECTDPDGDTLKYDIYFGDNSNPPLVSFEQTNDNFNPEELNTGTTYYWKIVAKDGRGGVTEGDKWTFQTVPNPVIVIPNPEDPSPSNDETNVLWDSVTLSWEVSGSNDDLYFDIYFGKDEIPEIFRIGYDATEITIDDLDRGQRYYWQIVVTDEPYSRDPNSEKNIKELQQLALERREGKATLGPIWNFITKENQNPNTIVNLSPFDGKTYTLNDVLLSWDTSDPDGDTLNYDIYLGKGKSELSIFSSNVPDKNFWLYDLTPGINYSWKIIAKDNYGGISESDTFEFSPRDIVKLIGGFYHTTALNYDGKVLSWGRNNYGQLGNGSASNKLLPSTTLFPENIIDISCGDFHTLVLTSDGNVYSSGRNNYGQLGIGTTTSYELTPVPVTSIYNFVKVVAGGSFSLALTDDGQVLSWGLNYSGQLGDGTETDRNSPVLVTGLSNVIDISAGLDFSIALKSDGTVWSWGSYTGKQLGYNSTTNVLTPTQITTLPYVVQISSGDNHTLALGNDGSVWSWGRNPRGQLGIGTSTNNELPSKINKLYGINQICALGSYSYYYGHSFALGSDGTIWSWGDNQYGQLGIGTSSGYKSSPVKTSIYKMFFINGGISNSFAKKDDGTIWSWGNNDYGQLGDGTKNSRNSPVEIK